MPSVGKQQREGGGGGFAAFYPRTGSAYSVGGVCLFREIHHLLPSAGRAFPSQGIPSMVTDSSAQHSACHVLCPQQHSENQTTSRRGGEDKQVLVLEV